MGISVEFAICSKIEQFARGIVGSSSECVTIREESGQGQYCYDMMRHGRVKLIFEDVLYSVDI